MPCLAHIPLAISQERSRREAITCIAQIFIIVIVVFSVVIVIIVVTSVAIAIAIVFEIVIIGIIIIVITICTWLKIKWNSWLWEHKKPEEHQLQHFEIVLFFGRFHFVQFFLADSISCSFTQFKMHHPQGGQNLGIDCVKYQHNLKYRRNCKKNSFYGWMINY